MASGRGRSPDGGPIVRGRKYNELLAEWAGPRPRAQFVGQMAAFRTAVEWFAYASRHDIYRKKIHSRAVGYLKSRGYRV